MKRLSSLRSDNSGIAAVEFAFVLPILLVLLCGSIEIGHMMLARLTLEGAVVDAARIATASLESTESERNTAMRARIARSMSAFPLGTGQTITIETRVYRDFSTAYPESYIDGNGDGDYDLGETFTDRNQNGVWDNTTQIVGTMGGVGDVVSITATYPKQLMFGFLRTQMTIEPLTNLTATTVVRNEAVSRT